jgi:hypothetical protein
MTKASMPARAGAIALGAIFAVGTGLVLFSDVKSWSDLTTDHAMTALVLLGTLAAGHWFGPAVRHWRLFSALGLAAMFIGGTFYCVTTSAARNAEGTAGKLAHVRAVNGDRAALEKDLTDAKARLLTVKAARDQACRDGDGRLCKGGRVNVANAQADVDLAASKLEGGPVAVVENAGMKHAALVYSILTGLDPAALERAIDLLFPFVKALFLELGTLTFFGIGFARLAEPAVSQPGEPVSNPVPSETEVEFVSSDKVIDWVREFRSKHGRDPQIPELQGEFHIPKTTAWRRIKSA